MKFHFLILCILLSFGFGTVAFAQTEAVYTPIVGVPGLSNVDGYSTEQYIQALYYLAISVGAILAVYKIISGGVKWMFDGVITHKEEGKKEIWGAILGLAIILTAVLVLNEINVNLTRLNIFDNAPSLGEINAASNTPTPVQFGTVLSGFYVSPEQENALRQGCQNGVVEKNIQPIGKGGSITTIGCYAPITNIDAGPGNTFDSSLYPPSQRAEAEAKFEETCDPTKNEIHATNGLRASSCENSLVSGDVNVGDRVNVAGVPSEVALDAMAKYEASCPPGEVRTTNDGFIECYTPNPNILDDVQVGDNVDLTGKSQAEKDILNERYTQTCPGIPIVENNILKCLPDPAN